MWRFGQWRGARLSLGVRRLAGTYFSARLSFHSCPSATILALPGCRYHLTVQDAHVMAIINNLVLGLLLRQGVVNVPDARRHYDANPEEAARLLLLAPA